jgi:segregation and condensation protein B
MTEETTMTDDTPAIEHDDHAPENGHDEHSAEHNNDAFLAGNDEPDERDEEDFESPEIDDNVENSESGDSDETEEEDDAEDGDNPDDTVVAFPANATEHAELIRMAEALLFAAAEPLDIDTLAARLPDGADVGAVIEDLQKLYEPRGVNLVRVANKWMFRTAENLSFLMERSAIEQRKLSRAAMETLAIIAYHQPVTRAEIEEIRGVSVSKGTIDVLMETSWVRLRGRKRTPGRPVTYGTTETFLVHFGLENVGDLPGLDDLKSAGLLDGRLPPGFEVPIPTEGGVEGDGEFEDEPAEEYGQAHDEHLAGSEDDA